MVENTQTLQEQPEPQQLGLFSLADAQPTHKLSENPLEEVKNAFDITCKQAFVQNPVGALKLMGIPDQMTLIEKNVELQRTTDLKVDLAFWVEYSAGSPVSPSGERFLLHVEFQRQAPQNMPQRMAEYNMELALANAERDHKGRIFNYPNIRSYVVSLA